MKRLFQADLISKINWFTFIKYNFLSRNVSRAGLGYLVPFWGAQLKIDRSARIKLNDGDLMVNFFETDRKAVGASFILGKNATIEVEESFSLFYGADIKIFDEGKLTLGSGYSNAGLQIRCKRSIRIGKKVMIAKDVIIMDSDAHEIKYDGYVMSKDVCVGDNVWIGTRAMVLKGVTIGEGSIVAAGAVVTKNIPSHSLVTGVPANVIKTDVTFVV